MTWRNGLPPQSGWHQVRWDPEEDSNGDRVFITVFEHGTWMFPGVVPCAIASTDETIDDPLLYPSEETPYAVWLDESPIVGRREPLPPIVQFGGIAADSTEVATLRTIEEMRRSAFPVPDMEKR